MLFRKRQRERIMKMVKNCERRQEEAESEENSVENSENIREIPGYYYDYEKKKYFPIKNSHMKVFSEYLSDKNKKIVSIEGEKTKFSSKDSNSRLNKNFESERKIRKGDLERPENFSLYKLVNISKMLKSPIVHSNKNYKNLIKSHINSNLFVEELKYKSYLEKYEFLHFDGKDFLCTLNNSEEKTKILIERIIIKKSQTGKFVLDIVNVREIIFTFGDKNFTNFKFLKTQNKEETTLRYLIVVSNFELFFITLEEIFTLKEPKFFSVNLTKNVRYKNIPCTYDWPMILPTNKRDEFILLYYKCKNNYWI
jgi:hypothetical protein